LIGIGRFLGAVLALGTIAWLGLLIASIIWRPPASKKMRVLDRLLIVISILMFFAFSALYTAVQAQRRARSLASSGGHAVVLQGGMGPVPGSLAWRLAAGSELRFSFQRYPRGDAEL
jgi:hypothetical protein